jgi:hypothetical protein
MHFFSDLEGLANIGCKHRGLIHPINNTSSLRTLIKLFTNSSNGEEKMNFPLPKELVSRTLIRKVARPKRVYTIKRQISA